MFLTPPICRGAGGGLLRPTCPLGERSVSATQWWIDLGLVLFQVSDKTWVEPFLPASGGLLLESVNVPEIDRLLPCSDSSTMLANF